MIGSTDCPAHQSAHQPAPQLAGRDIGLLVRLLVPLFAVTRCVPLVDVEGAPCPCPSGFSCCDTLLSCVPADEPCPTTYPPSTNTACLRDSECAPNARCYGWSDSTQQARGPGRCRTTCPETFDCADSEVCELAPHDGAPLEALNVARMCVPETPPSPGCTLGCSQCPDGQLGKTYCMNGGVSACLIALDPVCGLTCEVLELLSCGSDRQCVEGPAGPACSPECLGCAEDLCSIYSCSECTEGIEPGSVGCEGDQVSTCAKADYRGSSCGEICLQSSESCPMPSQHCVEDPVNKCRE